MKAEIVSIGTELLMGEITDTNATYLTNQLTAFGVETTHVTQVRDNLDEIVEVLSGLRASFHPQQRPCAVCEWTKLLGIVQHSSI